MHKHILVTILLAMFIALMGVGIIAPIVPVYAADLGATGMGLGLMVAGFSVSRGFLQPFVGNLSDRHGKKRFLAAGLLTYALAGITYTFAESIFHLILIRIFHGVGSAMIIPIAMAYIGDLSPEGKEGKYMGMLNVALFSGLGSGPVIGGVFFDAWGMNSAFYAMSALTCVSFTLVLIFLPTFKTRQSYQRGRRLFTTLRDMLQSSSLVGVLFLRMATTIIIVPTMAFLPILMNRFMEATGIQIGVVVASRTLVNAALQTPFGTIADRYNKVSLLVAGCLIISFSIFMVPLAQGFYQLIALFVLTGIGESVIWPTLGALATEHGRTYGQGSMMGVFNMAMSAGIFVGSIGAGALMDLFGLTYAFFIISIFLAISTFVAALMIHRPAQGIPDKEYAQNPRR